MNPAVLAVLVLQSTVPPATPFPAPEAAVAASPSPSPSAVAASPAAAPAMPGLDRDLMLRVAGRAPVFGAEPERLQPRLRDLQTAAGGAPEILAEVEWDEGTTLKHGVAVIVRAGDFDGTPLAVERGFALARFLPGRTLAEVAAEMASQAPREEEARLLGELRTVISAQKAFHKAFGAYGVPRCLARPGDCVGGTTEGEFLEEWFLATREQRGYRRQFHAGAEKAKGSGLLRTWAFTIVPATEPAGRSAYCGDHTGVVCAIEGGVMPPLTGGACPKACSPVR